MICCRALLRQKICWPLVFAPESAESSKEAKSAMIAMTVSNSIMVKPDVGNPLSLVSKLIILDAGRARTQHGRPDKADSGRAGAQRVR